jgi:hypothetical protein
MTAGSLVVGALALSLALWWGILNARDIRYLEGRLEEQGKRLAEQERRRNGVRKLIEAWPPDLAAFEPEDRR